MPNENDMMDKNAMLIEAYRIQVARWNKRRDIEWRLTLTLWSTALIITFALAGKYEFPRSIGFIHLALFVIYCIWIYHLWNRNAWDKEQMYNYQKKINKKLGICPNDVSEKGWKYWNIFFQIGFTVVILFCSFLILHCLPRSEPSFSKKLVEFIERNIR